MGRATRNSGLETREARRRLKQTNEPYWHAIDNALSIGYRKGAKGGTWHLRRRAVGRYEREVIGIADDYRDADGKTVLDYFGAQRKARERAVQLERGSGFKSILTVRHAADYYLAWYKDHRKAYSETEATIRAHILPHFADKAVQDLGTRDIREWLNRLATKAPRRRTRIGVRQKYGEKPATNDEKRARKATANRILTVLKAILNRAFEDELVPDDSAWRKVRPFENADEPVVRFLSEAESTRLVNASPADFRQMVKAALFTGARYSELATLRARDYNPQTGMVYFRPAKSGRGRNVPLSDGGRDFFETVSAGKTGDTLMFTKADGKQWGKNHQVRPLADACTTAKIAPAITFHELRHTYASTLAQRGIDLLTLSKLLGHADTRITSRHYAHLCDDSLRIAVRQLPAFGHQSENKVTAIR